MNQSQLQHLITKLYSIDKGLGGNADKTQKAKKSGEFDVIKDMLIAKLFEINKKQNERDEKMTKYGNDRDQIALGVRIRDDLRDCEKLVQSLQTALTKMSKNSKKYSQAEIELKTKLTQKYSENLENMKARELGEKGGEEYTISEKPLTVKEYQKGLFKQPDRKVVYELTKDEEEAMLRFQQNDNLIDEKVDIVIAGIGQLKDNAVRIGGKIDETEMKVKGLTKEVDKTNETLMNSNKKLKELLIKFRQPNKFCLDITLLLLFIGIIAVIINMAKNG